MYKSDTAIDEATSVPAVGSVRAMDANHRGLWAVSVRARASSGPVHADGVIEAWNGLRWDTIATFSVDGTTEAGGVYSFEAAFSQIRTTVNTLTGTGATVSVQQNVA